VNKEQRLVNYLSEIYKVKAPKVKDSDNELNYYENGIIYLSKETESDERFFILIHEFVHHITNHRHNTENFNTEAETKFQNKVSALYYSALLLMKEEDYEEWFQHKRDIREIVDSLNEYMNINS